jgi:hypothetical protein
MTPNEIIVAALSEAGYPPNVQDEGTALWLHPLPPLDLVEKARDLAYPDTDPERIEAGIWPSLGEFFVDKAAA